MVAPVALPFDACEAEFCDAVDENDVVLGVAEPGAGKSTRGPRFLLKRGYRIVHTQPRRVAVLNISDRIAYELGEPLGETVGYELGGGDRKVSNRTKLRVASDGLALIKEMMRRAGRRDVLIIDEVHEWNLNIELLVAWFLNERRKGRLPFKLVLLSATVEAERLAEHLGGAKVIRIPGRTFPIVDRDRGASLVEDAAQLLREGRNTLVFVEGKAEVLETIEKIRATGVDAEILPLYGELDKAEQQKCFKLGSKVRCVVSTNVAQTSVTIDYIDAVVDSGMERRIEVVDGVEGLVLRAISKADSQQRRGRAGRTKDGIYIDHCPETDRPDFPVAEILRRRLDQLVLRCASAGIDMEELPFFHQPELDEIRRAKATLRALSCIRDDGTVTPLGNEVGALPVSVRSARIVVEGVRRGVADDALSAAAILEVGKGGIIDRKSKVWRATVEAEKESDLLAQIALLNSTRGMDADAMTAAGLHPGSVKRVRDVRRQILAELRGVATTSSGDRAAVVASIASGMVESLFRRTEKTFIGADGVERSLTRDSIVPPETDWVVAVPVDREGKDKFQKPKTFRELQLATKVDPELVLGFAPHLTVRSTGTALRYVPGADDVVRTDEVHFRGQLISKTDVSVRTEPAAAAVIASWLAKQML